MTGMGSPSAGCHPQFPRPSNDQRGLAPAVINVMSLVTSPGTVLRPSLAPKPCAQALLPDTVGKPVANPIAPTRSMHPAALCGL